MFTASTGWSLTGNSGTTASTSAIGVAANNNFVGTTDAKDFVLATNNLERMRVTASGNLGIGTTSPIAKLDVAVTTASGSFTAWVSAANTVTVRFANNSVGALDPASGTFKVTVHK